MNQIVMMLFCPQKFRQLAYHLLKVTKVEGIYSNDISNGFVILIE